MTNPLVSFVVPVYRKSPYVFRKCLEHLFDQSLKETEVICVFDGPDEELKKVAVEFPKAQLYFIEHGGASKARNYGFSVAKGEYLCAWDADCYIKPDTAKRWIEEFEVSGADFVYSGYEIEGEKGGFDSEPFDPYRLTCGNLVASMFPIKREKAPKWDESLEAGQDWDFWLTAVERGCKGVWIEGSGWTTEPSDKDSISAKGLSGPNRSDIIKKIREKHGIFNREKFGIFTMDQRNRALRISEVLGGDYICAQGLEPDVYKTLFNLGYNFLSRWEGIAEETTKIQYWNTHWIEALKQAKYASVMETIRIAKKCVNLCGTQYEKNALDELGIQADVVPLPLTEKQIAETAEVLPEEFSILLLADNAYGKLFQEMQQDLPHIKFGYQQGDVKDYSCLMSFYSFASVDEAITNALVNGRNVISNVQAPFCGFIDPQQEWETFKKDLYNAVNLVRSKPFNKEAKDYYLQLASPVKFRETIASYAKPVLEVVG